MNLKDLKGNKFVRDIARHAAMFLIALLAIIPMWEATQVILYFIGVIGLIGMGVHLMRRIFFPHISMDDLAEKAKETPLAAAIVFFSITLFICVLFHSATSLVGLK